MKSVLDDSGSKSVDEIKCWMLDVFNQIRTLFVHRSFRVITLAIAIAVMSGVDLYLTILYITHTGMNEMNPLARAMMEYQSPAILALWKGGTVLLSLGILILIRKQRSAEMGAWVGCLVMGWLMLHWGSFIHNSKEVDIDALLAQSKDNPSWIMMPTQAQVLEGVGETVID